MNGYEDIIDKERPVSSRKKMSLLDRAAQFAPFAALTGLDEMMDETADEVNAGLSEVLKILPP